MMVAVAFRVFLFTGILSSWSARAAAQQTVPLTVDSGRPIAVIMTQKLRYKLNEPVHTRVTEPVFAFDREVIPSDTEVTGRIVGYQSS